MMLSPGTTLGPYEITAKLGEGGMGEVWRATDTRLDRDVALKVLPEAFAEDSDRLARFQREAKVLASLNHPNIGHIYGLEEADGTQALVLELVEGETLAERIANGPIPLDEALPIARQIAEALEAAHERGVIHRDLKPANVKLTPDGKVKVLDFGLAKALEPEVSEPDLSQSPTLTAEATRLGTVLGTAAYMSPEQARGKPVDKRADIWAFGCVLYEILTGRRAFGGDTAFDVATAVVSSEPEWSLLPSSTPPALRQLLLWCARKDPKERLQHIGDARLVLSEIGDGGVFGEDRSGLAEPPPGARRLTVAAWIASIFATAVVTWWAAGWLGSGTPALPGTTDELRIRQLTGRSSDDTVHTASLSPDGEQLAFATQEGLFLQIVETGEERLLPLPEELQVLEVDWLGATDLLFSAFTGDAFGLYRTSIFGGRAHKLEDGAWRAAVSPDASRIAYLEGVPSRTVTMAGPDGEEPRTVLDLGSEGAAWEIAWSPAGQWLLVGVWGGARDPFDTTLEAIGVEDGTREEVLADPRFFQSWRGFLPFVWTAEDRLILGRREPPPNQSAGNLWQVPIDRSTATVKAELARLTRLTGVNPKDLSASVDGRRIAFLQERSQSDVMVGELLDDDTRLADVRRLTRDERQDAPLAWSRDRRAIFFQSTRTGAFDIFRKSLAGGSVEYLADRGPDTNFLEVSQDGSSILFFRSPDLIRAPARGGPAETLLEAGGDWPGIGCDATGERCLMGERLPDEPTYVFYDFDLDAGRGEEILRIEDHPPFTNWDLSPDGSRLVVGHNDDRLRIFELATGEETVLTHEGLSYGEFPAWSADGRGLFVDGGYATRGRLQKGLLYISLDDGEAHVLRLNWGEWNTHPVPSRDGERLAFAANFFYDGNAWMLEVPGDR